jgi:hypothetical protein
VALPGQSAVRRDGPGVRIASEQGAEEPAVGVLRGVPGLEPEDHGEVDLPPPRAASERPAGRAARGRGALPGASAGSRRPPREGTWATPCRSPRVAASPPRRTSVPRDRSPRPRRDRAASRHERGRPRLPGERTGRLDRSSGVTARSRSSAAIASDTLDCVYDSSRAAAEKERWVATARNSWRR